MTLALFDFDGTITTNDSMIDFIRFAKGDYQYFLGMLVLSPTLILYLLKIIPNNIAKQKMLTYFFKGMKEFEFKTLTQNYSLTKIDTIIRQKAIAQIHWHQQQNHTIVVVSASLECWLEPWCTRNNLTLISTRMKFENGRATGKFINNNCHGPEKVKRIQEIFNLEEFNHIYAYGDSNGDKEMLSLAKYQYYKPFR